METGMTNNEYATALRVNASDNAGFDALIETLRTDRSIHQPELREIAIQFLGYEVARSNSRQALLQRIVDRQALNARQVARMGTIERSMNSW